MTAPNAPTSRHPETYYLATAADLRDRPTLRGEIACDVCVVGGGYTGLSAALHLAERGYDTVLLEAERLGWGASGRNGGQLCTGLRKSQAEIERLVGRDDARRLWIMAEEAKAIVKERTRRHEIACELSSGLIAAAWKPDHLPDLERNADHLREVYDYPHIRVLERHELNAAVGTTVYHGGTLDTGAGHLHALNYALGLARAAEAAGARLFENSRATALTRQGTPGATTAQGAVRARHLVLACNGYLGRLEPRLDGQTMPINNFVLATEPMGAARAAALIRDNVAVANTKFVLDYYRLSSDHRLLFGGGENYRPGFPKDLKSFVRGYMLRIYPQLADLRIDYAWGGTLAITLNRLPCFGRLDPEIYYAHGFSGQGVALTSLAGKLIAEAVAGTAERFDVFARLPRRLFPGGPLLRWPATVLGLLYYGLRDRL